MPRLSNEDASRIREIESLLCTWNGEPSGLASVMEPLRILLRAEKSLTYTFAVERGEIVIGDTFNSRMPELHDFVATSRSSNVDGRRTTRAGPSALNETVP